MSNDVCGVCKQWNDLNQDASASVLWIVCSRCEASYHPLCVSMNSKDFDYFSQTEKLWFCAKCIVGAESHCGTNWSNRFDGLLQRFDAFDEQLKSNTASWEKSISSCVNNLGAKLLSALDVKIDEKVSALELKIDDKVSMIINGKFDSIHETLSASVSRTVDTACDKKIEAFKADNVKQIDALISDRIDVILSQKLNIVRDELKAEFQGALDVVAAPGLACNQPLMDKIAKLEEVNDRSDRMHRRNNLVIRNMPVFPNEKKDGLMACLLNIAVVTKFNFQDGDVVSIERFKNSSHRLVPILVKFANAGVRDRFFGSYFKNLQLFSLNALGLSNANSRIYLNEHLTDRNMVLYNHAMQLKAKGKLRRVSTFNGQIFVTVGRRSRSQVLSSVEELSSLVSNTSSGPVSSGLNVIPNNLGGPGSTLTGVDFNADSGDADNVADLRNRTVQTVSLAKPTNVVAVLENELVQAASSNDDIIAT